MPAGVWSAIYGIAVIVGALVPWWPLRTSAVCVATPMVVFLFVHFLVKVRNVFALRYFCVTASSLLVISGHILRISTIYDGRGSTELALEVLAAAVFSLIFLSLSAKTMEVIGGDRRY